MNSKIKIMITLLFSFCLFISVMSMSVNAEVMANNINGLSVASKIITESSASKNLMLNRTAVFVKTDNGKKIAVNIDKSILGKISAWDAYELANDYKDNDNIGQINIHNVVEAERTVPTKEYMSEINNNIKFKWANEITLNHYQMSSQRAIQSPASAAGPSNIYTFKDKEHRAYYRIFHNLFG